MSPEIRRSATAAAFVIAVCGLFVAAEGGVGQEPPTGPELQAFLGTYLIDDPDPAPDEPPPELRNSMILGARAAYHTPWRFFVEGEVAYVPSRLSREGVQGDVGITLVGGSIGYDFPLSPRATLFLVTGAAANRWSTIGLDPEVDLDVNFGAGARVFLNRTLAVRFEVRDHYMKDGFSATRRQLTPGLAPEPSRRSINNLELSGGISFFPDGRADADDDGVPDGRDLCPGTPPGEAVDERGCPVDEDGDGVPDPADRCPDTPPGADADERGCPVDEDGDGVPNGIDRCPDTRDGAHVDEAGCALDWDGDGVPNGIDRCPETPFGTEVDEAGCPADADGDGVPDAADRCPDTPDGIDVADDGCPESPAERALLEEGRAVLDEVAFQPGTATFLEGARQALDRLGEILSRRPGLRVEIQAHSDAVGNAEANRRITQRRAEVVREYLLESFPDLEPARLTARGLGETRPVASNQTPEGREANRRVEVVVLEGDASPGER